MKKHLLAFFTYSSRERRGIMGLLLLIALLNLLFEGYALFQKTSPTIQLGLDTLCMELDVSTAPPATNAKRFYRDTLQNMKAEDADLKSPLFFFDPNALSLSDWQRLGLSAKQGTGILHYVEKGGRFRIKSDLRKMYCITDSIYKKLAPFIQLPESIPSQQAAAKALPMPIVPKQKRTVELNTADSITLLSLPGIGPWYAFRIMQYRERLGGFCRKEQLFEVRGMDTLRYQQIAPVLIVDLFELRKMNINTASVDELGRHPYIGFLLAKMLASYRLQHGFFRRVEEIRQLPLVDADLYSKLAPYLTISP